MGYAASRASASGQWPLPSAQQSSTWSPALSSRVTPRTTNFLEPEVVQGDRKGPHASPKNVKHCETSLKGSHSHLMTGVGSFSKTNHFVDFVKIRNFSNGPYVQLPSGGPRSKESARCHSPARWQALRAALRPQAEITGRLSPEIGWTSGWCSNGTQGETK